MKVYLNALGLMTPLGRDKREVASNLFQGSRTGLLERPDLIPLRTVRVGAVPWPLPAIPDRLTHLDCRNNRLALAALHQIEDPVRTMADRVGAHRIAAVMGTSTSGIAEGEAALASRLERRVWPSGYRYSQQEMGNLAAFTAAYFELTGPAYTIATACSSSAKALAAAQRLIAAGLCDAAVAGGADTLCRMTLNGFDSLEALAQDYCNPFSRNRDGINIGEGAAVFLVSREPSPVALLGVGESSDAYHVSAPDPEGAGAALAMLRALKHAQLGAQRYLLHQPAWHGDGIERRNGSPRGRASIRRAHAMQLHQAHDRSPAGRCRCCGSRVPLAHARTEVRDWPATTTFMGRRARSCLAEPASGAARLSHRTP